MAALNSSQESAADSLRRQCEEFLASASTDDMGEAIQSTYTSLNSLLLSSSSASLSSSPISMDAVIAFLRAHGGAGRQVCQKQFKRNDIVWICKQCQRDETYDSNSLTPLASSPFL